MKLRLALGLIAAATASIMNIVPAAAADDGKIPPGWGRVHEAYEQARERSDASSIDKALDLADEFIKVNPQDGRALTYRGSLASMRARESWMPWKKLSMLHEGIAQMDEGIDLLTAKAKGSSEEIEARMVRGITSARIPQAFGRGSVAVGDFRFIEQSPIFGKMKPQDQATTLAWLSALVSRQGKEQESASLFGRASAIDATIAEKIVKAAK